MFLNQMDYREEAWFIEKEQVDTKIQIIRT